MKRKILASIAVSVTLLFLTYIPTNCQTTAESNSHIHFNSGITLFSPVNTTYYGESLVLNLSLNTAGILGSIDNQIKMSYAIDGTNIGSIPLRSDGDIHIVSGAFGTVNLPELSDGQHTLTIKLYGISYPYHPKQYSWYVDTVQFSTYHVDPKLNQSTTPTPSPVPEFPFVAVVLLFVFSLLITIFARKRICLKACPNHSK